MDSRVCLVNNFWIGGRRFEYSEYQKDNLYFLKKQIECLQTYKHNLTKIIFNFNVIPEHYKYLSEVYSITPKQIQGAEVEINIRENVGISYGAWSDTFKKYKSEYDYYVFNEDDYFFVQHDWDSYLVNKHNSHDDCGYLCMVIREPAEWNKFKKHAGSSVGIASTENLMKIYSKYGKLPSLDENLEGQEGNYEGWSDIQLDFGFVFLELGLNIYDVRDDYAILFQKSSPVNPSIQTWKFHWHNEEYLQVAPFYWEVDFGYWKSTDLEFLPDYEVTTHKEAMYCYDRSLPYHDNGVDENGVFTGWIKKTYYFDS
jgi:hypothetical protein